MIFNLKYFKTKFYSYYKLGIFNFQNKNWL